MSQVLELVKRYLPGPFRPSGGSNVLTRCPFHKGGQEHTPSFSINYVKGVFQCFTCHETGTLKTLLRKLNVPYDRIDSELAAVEPELERSREQHRFDKRHQFVSRDPFRADYVLPESVLGQFNFCPTALLEKGFTQETLHDLNIGYDLTNNRITYPLRDLYGNLAGVIGGVTPLCISPHPKYKVYQGRRQLSTGRWVDGDFGKDFDQNHPDFVCENHDFLWHFDELWAQREELSAQNATVFIAEGFKACMWMLQNGFKNTVALMGSYLSDRQLQLLQRLGLNTVLALDNDMPGIRATLRVGSMMQEKMYSKIWVMRYPENELGSGSQPDWYPGPQLHEMVAKSIPLFDFFLDARKRGLFHGNDV